MLYNGVLRARPDVRRRQNSYTTSLHVINSACLKLSLLSKAVKVYRGISGGRLPDSFVYGT